MKKILTIILILPIVLMLLLNENRIHELKIDNKLKELVTYKEVKLNSFLKYKIDNQIFKFVKEKDGYIYFLDKHLQRLHKLDVYEIETTFKNYSYFEIIDDTILSERKVNIFISKYGYIFYKKMKFRITEYSFNDELEKYKNMIQFKIKTIINKKINYLMSNVSNILR